ncbi:MAG: glutamine-hydrolyzing carbamoyl-phosphate synthase small subunit [Dehalococcoidia bacterium]|nr:glutamine-hydrolyzing carbamoyl-phosphate synthase small subunit [Dehalococcoidia bacterium]
MSKKAYLVLEDGTVYQGESFGAEGTTFGEVVFDTSMTGYQEMLTDPSFAGQLLTLTYPLVGNYGMNEVDDESAHVQARGLIVREHCLAPSHYQSVETLHDYLQRQGIPGITALDTRAITRHLRSTGVLMGVLTSEMTPEEALNEVHRVPAYGGQNLVAEVSTTTNCTYKPGDNDNGLHVVLIDFGVKRSIMRNLNRVGCRVTVVPVSSTAEQVMALNPDGVLLSPGPGDPVHLGSIEDITRQLLGRVPIMAICLGHQVVARALGANTFKLKFGHHGGNHPVRDIATGRVHITTQNHGYAIDGDSLPDGIEISHVNLNDGTVEGLRHKDYSLLSIQYHAEGTPGPQDSQYLFLQFVDMMRSNQVAETR